MSAERAIIALLAELNIQPANDVSLYEIGPPLNARGFDQDQILNALFYLQRQKIVDLRGNRLHLLKALKGQLRQ
jgi:hypothetical protein